MKLKQIRLLLLLTVLKELTFSIDFTVNCAGLTHHINKKRE
ncbi:hypothetical protein [Parasutterella excrementihominis]